MMERKIFVYENFSSIEPKKIGILYVDTIRGIEHYSFEYDQDWLKESKFSFCLDPDISMFSGRQYTEKNIFGMFADASPDRWGRILMKRREAIKARRERRKPNKMYDSDFLLGVYDQTRVGALRFKVDVNGPFLSDDTETAAPPWATLRSLEEASRQFEKDDNYLNDKWLKQLLKPGSSLGGARPKATVEDEQGNLWIAKFPSKNDEYDVGAWEKVVHDLAKLCGLNVPESKVEKFSKDGSTFLVKRFDRDGEKRIHFASAMTMLGKNDGASSDDGSSYIDIVDFIKAYGSSPKDDLIELFKRIIFSMSVSNTDDHLRNHGFILNDKGWKLSPLYDVNPVPYGDVLSLNVDSYDNSISIDLAISSACFYDITKYDAEVYADEILTIVKNNWEQLAKKYGINRDQIEEMRPAFSVCYELKKLEE
jgi:serine/threonine-protein kinase HipA